MNPSLPDSIRGYRLLRELGRGGMATVFLAVQESLGREVALKLMSPELARDAAFAERFLREGRLVAQLRHPHIITLHDLDRDESGSPYLAMEYVRDGSVAARIGRLDGRTVLRCIREMALALHHAHRNGIVHRDVKPENILCRDDGSFVLSDFGVARLSNATSSLTTEGHVLGTPPYMSPEQWRGEELDGRSDLYALGVVLHQLLTGQLPYSGTDGWAIGMQHMTGPIPRLPIGQAMFQPLLDELMAKSRDQRPADGEAVASRVDALLASTMAMPPAPVAKPPVNATTPMPVRPPPPPPASPMPMPVASIRRTSNAPLVLAVVAGILVAMATAAWFLAKLVSDKDGGDAVIEPAAMARPEAAEGKTEPPAPPPEPAPAPATDPRDADIAAQLGELGIAFEVDRDGDFQIVQKTGEGRTQQLWVRRPVMTYGNLRIRELMSVGYRSDGDTIPEAIANRLLEDSQARKLGTWARAGGTAQFVVKIPASAGTKELADAIDATRDTADEIEQLLSGERDEF